MDGSNDPCVDTPARYARASGEAGSGGRAEIMARAQPRWERVQRARGAAAYASETK